MKPVPGGLRGSYAAFWRIAASFFAGLLCHLGSPPLNWTPFLPVGLMVLLAASSKVSVSVGIRMGLAFGVAYGSSLLLACAKWGILATLGLLALLGLYFAVPFSIAGVVGRRLRGSSPALALPLTWILWTAALDELYACILVSAPIAAQFPAAARSASYFGACGVEAGVWLSALFLLSGARRDFQALRVATGGILCLVIATFLPTYGEPRHPSPGETARLVVVQPNINWAEYAATGWSLDARHRIERRLQKITARATLIGGPNAIVVWPENGSGFPILQVESTRSRLAGVLGPSTQLLVSGPERAEGKEYISASLLTRRGVVARTRKSWLVPIVESGVTAGSGKPLDAGTAKLGVLLCYDVMIGSHVRQIERAGGELLILVADHTSLGWTALGEWHAGYALLRAAEVGRSLVLVSNSGPSLAFDVGRSSVGWRAAPERRLLEHRTV